MNPNVIILTEFNGWREYITRECKICGDVRKVKARSLIEKDKNGEIRKCVVCAAKERAKSKRKTHEQFIKELSKINFDIEILSEYVSNFEKVKCRCRIDGYEWNAKPSSLLQGHGCSECAHRNQNWGNEERFIKTMKSKYPTITVLNKFKRTCDKMHFRCNVCGYEWATEANVILNKDSYYGCPKCNGFASVSEREMIKRLDKCNQRVKYISGYNGILSHAKFKCMECGNEWITTPNSVLHGRGCPNCNLSHGALQVEKVLKEMELDFETEYRFKDCKDKRVLPFDFFIKSKNTCIEYDGEQHFMPVRFDKQSKRGTPQERFEIQKHRDNIKTKYCEEHNINLIRIPYTEFSNIETILNEKLA